MTGPGRYAASDGSFAKSAGSAAARGGILIGIAVLIGFALLAWGFDGGDSDAVTGPGDPGTTAPTDTSGTTAPTDTSGTSAPTDTSGTTAPTDTSGPGVVVDDPSEVQVIVLNGTGEGGLAADRGAALGAVGYKWTAGNASGTPVADSKVYYTDGFADEAKEVAQALSGGAGVVEMAPADPTTLATDDYVDDAAAADVLVVLGADGFLS